VLERFREMREDGEGVDEVEPVGAVGKRRGHAGDRDVHERQVSLAPLDHPRVDVAAGDARAGQVDPLPQDAAAAAAPVEECVELLDRRSVFAQKLPDEVGVLAAAREEIRRIGMSRPHLGAQACRRQRQPVGGIRLGAEPGPRRQRELVRTDDGACEVQLVGHVERGAPEPPPCRFGHREKVTLPAAPVLSTETPTEAAACRGEPALAVDPSPLGRLGFEHLWDDGDSRFRARILGALPPDPSAELWRSAVRTARGPSGCAAGSTSRPGRRTPPLGSPGCRRGRC
jgi:hypothetical protein